MINQSIKQSSSQFIYLFIRMLSIKIQIKRNNNQHGQIIETNAYYDEWMMMGRFN